MIFGTSTTLLKVAEHQRHQIEAMKRRSERSLASLSPEFRRRVQNVIAKLDRRGAIAVAFWGQRTLAQQQAAVKVGASPGLKSWHVAQHHVAIDHPGVHYVIHGEAADIVDARFLWSGPCANLNHPFWTALGQYAREEGLEWGGDWKPPIKKDVAHVQMKTRQFFQDFDKGAIA